MKIVALLVFSIALFFVRTWWGMAACAAVVVACVISARISVRQMIGPLAPMMVLAVFSVVFAVASAPAPEGLFAGLFVALRMVVLVAASLVVCFTTASTALLSAFARLISPLRVLRVPVDDIAFTLSLALRFIPVIADEFVAVRRAQIARGATLGGMTFRRKLRVWSAAFSAVFVGLFRRADVLATALDARCYGMDGK